jgi:hypothetical protein
MSSTHIFQSRSRRLAAGAVLSTAALLSVAACTGQSSAVGVAHSSTSAAAAQSGSTPTTIALPTATTASASAASSTGSSGTTLTAAEPARCGNADLQVKWGYGGEGQPEQSSAIDFVNISGHTCTMYGYPGLAIKVDGTVINAARVLGGAVPPLKSAQLVTLAPGGTAYAIAQWSLATPGHACYPTGTGAFEATAPNTTRTVVLSTAGHIGSKAICWGLAINPVEVGKYGLPTTS